MTDERVEVWREPGGAWRWRYVGPDGDGGTVELPANSPASSCEEAVEAAQTAYPGLPVVVDDADDGRGAASSPGSPQRRRGRWWPAAAAVAAAVLAVGHPRRWTALAAVVTTAAAVWRGRRWTAGAP